MHQFAKYMQATGGGLLCSSQSHLQNDVEEGQQMPKASIALFKPLIHSYQQKQWKESLWTPNITC